MSDFFSKRLKRERKELNKKDDFVFQIEEETLNKKNESKIIDPQTLKEKIINKLNPNIKIIMNQEISSQEIEMVHFSCIEEFVSWYEINKSFFSEAQQKPLNTLIEARDMTIGGCNCNRQHRKNMANQYFVNFWTNNKETDLLLTLIKALNTKKVIFGDFLTYP